MTRQRSRGLEAGRPIFVVGAPRSGTTILYEALAVHPEVAWFSNYSYRFPALGSLTAFFPRLWDLPLPPGIRRAEKRQRGPNTRRWFSRYLPWPSEVVDNVWERLCGPGFARDYLIGVTATGEQKRRTRSAISRLLLLQGRKRLLAKFTGPPRIGFLRSIFPDAVFVHLVRDGRAVVGSLLKVGFWRAGGGYERPWWKGGLAEDWESEWEVYERSPVALAAMQWRRILEVTSAESSSLPADQWYELRYEDFVSRPLEVFRDLLESCGLGPSRRVEAWVGSKDKYRNLNDDHIKRFSRQELAILAEILNPTLEKLGYV